MPTTYLLLRNNKQSGPLSLEELLQHPLQPHDLIWVEGRSASWRYPSEIDSLKPFVAQQQQPPVTPAATNPEPVKQASNPTTQSGFKGAAHIYVSLPAGRPQHAADETPQPPVNLEAKAEALYQRVQAFAEGRALEDTETRYARSLDDMKQEYGTWLVKQQQKKKHGSYKKKLLIAASVLIVTTTSFGISKWISHKPALPEQPVAGYTIGTLTNATDNQTTTASFHPATDTFTTTSQPAMLLQKDTVRNETAEQTNTNPGTVVKKKATPKKKITSAIAIDTITKTALPPAEPEPKPAVQTAVKKVRPLSQLVLVNGTLERNKKQTLVTLQNNSSEPLKLVAVTVTYLKKEDKPLSKETVYFYNVQPGTAPEVHAVGNRRAYAVRFDIGTITRADGSLYLMH